MHSDQCISSLIQHLQSGWANRQAAHGCRRYCQNPAEPGRCSGFFIGVTKTSTCAIPGSAPLSLPYALPEIFSLAAVAVAPRCAIIGVCHAGGSGAAWAYRIRSAWRCSGRQWARRDSPVRGRNGHLGRRSARRFAACQWRDRETGCSFASRRNSSAGSAPLPWRSLFPRIRAGSFQTAPSDAAACHCITAGPLRNLRFRHRLGTGAPGRRRTMIGA